MLSTQPVGLPSVPCRIRHLHCSPHCFYLRLSSPKHQTVTNGFPTSGKHLGWLQQIPLKSHAKLLLHLGSWSLWLLSPVSWAQGVWDKERSNAPKGRERTTCSPATHPFTRGKSFSLSANPFLICLWLDHTVIHANWAQIWKHFPQDQHCLCWIVFCLPNQPVDSLRTVSTISAIPVQDVRPGTQ